MLVTINTDASFNNKHKLGAFAFYIISNDFKILFSSVFEGKCVSPDDAEAKCIVNALKAIEKKCEKVDKIIINTDSLNAIALLTNDEKHIKRYMLRDYKKLKHVQRKYNEITNTMTNVLVIEFRHVKAHSGIDDKRSNVNEWCDVNAKRNLRNKIKSLGK